MNTSTIVASLATLSSELVQGPAESGAYVLNSGDVGLLKSLDKLSARAASALTSSGSSIAAHTEHVRYGLSLMNRWAKGEKNPWAVADWGAAWRQTSVSEDDWRRLREELKREARTWIAVLGESREVSDQALNGMVGSIVHLAYHLGAIRQIDLSTRGPREGAAP